MVLEFKSNKTNLINKKLERFNQLKIRNFSGTLEDYEERELNEVSEWLQIHN